MAVPLVGLVTAGFGGLLLKLRRTCPNDAGVKVRGTPRTPSLPAAR